MEKKQVEIQIYGAEQICASCVNLPSSKDTYEWLEAALTRKFPEQPFTVTYIDIFNPAEETKIKAFAQRVIDEDLFYPVVLIEEEIIAEGNPRLKSIIKTMETYGYVQAE